MTEVTPPTDRRADLSGADLRSAYLYGADLRSAKGIRMAGPVGSSGRMIYGVAHEGEAMIQCGCWWGTLSATLVRVSEEYAGRPELDDYLAAVRWVGGVR